MYICKTCGKPFDKKYSKWSNGNFCCRSCANTYSSTIRRQNINEQVHSKMYGKKYINGQMINVLDIYSKNPKLCSICGNIIPYEKRKSKTCCHECKKKLIHQTMKNKMSYNIGGYVPGSCKGKWGYYKGIYCDSTYELAYLIYCLDHNIDIKRCTETFEYEYEGKIHQYHPDFETNGELVEIKGYHTELVDIKLEAVKKPIKIMYYDDLINMFDYVAKTYNKKYNKHRNNFYELYDVTNDDIMAT